LNTLISPGLGPLKLVGMKQHVEQALQSVPFWTDRLDVIDGISLLSNTSFGRDLTWGMVDIGGTERCQVTVRLAQDALSSSAGWAHWVVQQCAVAISERLPLWLANETTLKYVMSAKNLGPIALEHTFALVGLNDTPSFLQVTQVAFGSAQEAGFTRGFIASLRFPASLKLALGDLPLSDLQRMEVGGAFAFSPSQGAAVLRGLLTTSCPGRSPIKASLSKLSEIRILENQDSSDITSNQEGDDFPEFSAAGPISALDVPVFAYVKLGSLSLAQLSELGEGKTLPIRTMPGRLEVTLATQSQVIAWGSIVELDGKAVVLLERLSTGRSPGD
jgi:flagellar motor switch/type III secretory pathway protein FliN